MAVTNWQMTVSAASPGVPNPFVIPGTKRSYAVSAGSALSVPDFDAQILASVGWILLAKNVVPTSGRPVGALAGQSILDSTVGAILISDGKGNWLHSATGVVS